MKFIDLHQDLYLHTTRPELFPDFAQNQTSPDMLEDSEINLLVASVFPVPDDGNFKSEGVCHMITEEIKGYKKLIAERGWSLVTKKSELDLNSENLKVILHIEGLNALNKDNFALLDKWYQMGVRSLGVVWNLGNELGGGDKDTNKGLTKLGEEVLKWSEEKGAIFDFAHMNDKTFSDAKALVEKPILVTHTALRSFVDRKRNISDSQIRAVANSGGVVGIFFATNFIGKNQVSVQDIARHLLYMVDLIGVEHVAIGSDFGGILSETVVELSSIGEIDNLWRTLQGEGLSLEDIQKIAYSNAMRVIEGSLL